MTLLTDASIVDYVNGVAQNIVRNSDVGGIPFTTKIVDSGEINAVGLPVSLQIKLGHYRPSNLL